MRSMLLAIVTFNVAAVTTLNRDATCAWLTAFFAGLTVLSLLIRRGK